MVHELLSCAVIFSLVAFGLAWPLASRLALDPVEKLVASVVLSLLGVYLAAGAVYVLRLPLSALWLLPALAAVGLATGTRALATLLRDRDTRALLLGQAAGQRLVCRLAGHDRQLLGWRLDRRLV